MAGYLLDRPHVCMCVCISIYVHISIGLKNPNLLKSEKFNKLLTLKESYSVRKRFFFHQKSTLTKDMACLKYSFIFIL